MHDQQLIGQLAQSKQIIKLAGYQLRRFAQKAPLVCWTNEGLTSGEGRHFIEGMKG